MIAIVDYGMGNLKSVAKAFEHLGAPARIVTKPKELARAEKVVVPGVGAFKPAMQNLKKDGFLPALDACAKTGRPLLGVCLGVQLFFDYSYEGGKTRGLGFLKGEAVHFKTAFQKRRIALKVPHIGWNQLELTAHGRQCPLLKGVREGEFVYFVHSYFVLPASRAIIASRTDYGISFASMVWQDNIFGIQFHPEKSHTAGLRMLENFIRM